MLAQAFFTENPELSRKRYELEDRRDRLVQAASKLTSVASIAHIRLPSAAAASANSSNSCIGDDKTSGGAGRSHSSTSTTKGRTNSLDNTDDNTEYPRKLSQIYEATSTNGMKQEQKLTFIINNIAEGLGVSLTTTTTADKQPMIKEFRQVRDNTPSPCQLAGMRVGDKILSVNQRTPRDSQEVAAILKNVTGKVEFVVSRAK